MKPPAFEDCPVGTELYAQGEQQQSYRRPQPSLRANLVGLYAGARKWYEVNNNRTSGDPASQARGTATGADLPSFQGSDAK